MNEGYYRFSAKFISRKNGRNSVEKIAYNNRSNLTDRNTGKKFYHRSRGDTLHSELIVPENAPPGFKERINGPEAFASEIERCERRHDAQLIQEVTVFLPHELALHQNVELVRSAVNKLWVSKGRVSQIDIHPPPPDGDPRQVHAHILLSLRNIQDDSFGLKNRGWTYQKGRSLIKEWRAEWANAVNAAYERHGYRIRVDHRSLKDRGIDRPPQRPKGQARANIERRDKKLREQALHQEIKDSPDIEDQEISHDFEPFFMD